MEVAGFTDEQFSVFDIPGFADRMTAIRSLVRPRLAPLGEALAPQLSTMVGHPLYPHVALHARRRVNPPEDTWVAFGRSPRGYKAYAHFELGVSAAGVFVGLVLKDESDDRSALGAHILAHTEKARTLARKLKKYELVEIGAADASKLKLEDFLRLGDGLVNKKTSTFHLVRRVPASDGRVSDGAALAVLAQELIAPMLPFYKWATTTL